MTSEASTTSVEAAARVGSAVQSVISGKPETVRLALTVLLAGGHLLIEDVPGVGKTMLAKSLARSLGCSMRRIQFTPDLLPGDVVGVSVFNRETRDFEFKPGAVFANIVLGDDRLLSFRFLAWAALPVGFLFILLFLLLVGQVQPFAVSVANRLLADTEHVCCMVNRRYGVETCEVPADERVRAVKVIEADK
jgi:hypothetical protein